MQNSIFDFKPFHMKFIKKYQPTKRDISEATKNSESATQNESSSKKSTTSRSGSTTKSTSKPQKKPFRFMDLFKPINNEIKNKK